MISPLNYRSSENGSLCWAIKENKPLAVPALLKNPFVDPSSNNNIAIRLASDKGDHSVVQLLLQGIHLRTFRKFRIVFEILSNTVEACSITGFYSVAIESPIRFEVKYSHLFFKILV
jgi:hypothetical protein